MLASTSIINQPKTVSSDGCLIDVNQNFCDVWAFICRGLVSWNSLISISLNKMAVTMEMMTSCLQNVEVKLLRPKHITPFILFKPMYRASVSLGPSIHNGSRCNQATNLILLTSYFPSQISYQGHTINRGSGTGTWLHVAPFTNMV